MLSKWEIEAFQFIVSRGKSFAHEKYTKFDSAFRMIGTITGVQAWLPVTNFLKRFQLI